jgi:hypothetical protein
VARCASDLFVLSRSLSNVADNMCCSDQFKDTMLECAGISGTAYCVRMGMSKSRIMQDLLSRPDLAGRFRNILILMMIESVIPFCSMEVERIFSAHNLVKSTLRTRLAIANSSAKTKLMCKRQILGPFGEPKMVCLERSINPSRPIACDCIIQRLVAPS